MIHNSDWDVADACKCCGAAGQPYVCEYCGQGKPNPREGVTPVAVLS